MGIIQIKGGDCAIESPENPSALIGRVPLPTPQDWEFPTFDTSPFDVKILGTEMIDLDWNIFPECPKCHMPAWMQKLVDRFNWNIYISGRWMAYGGIMIAAVIDLIRFVGLSAPCVTFRRVVAPLRGPGQAPGLPFACCVGSLRSVGRCGRCSCWCRFRVRGAQ